MPLSSVLLQQFTRAVHPFVVSGTPQVIPLGHDHVLIWSNATYSWGTPAVCMTTRPWGPEGTQTASQYYSHPDVSCWPMAQRIPLAIVQTSRDGRSRYAHTWRDCYPGARVQCFDDEQVSRMLKPTRWAAVWHRLTGVQQADVFRYWYLHQHGGVYADTDVSCNRALPDHVLRGHKLVVGLESNVTDAKLANQVGHLHGGQYVQWTMAATAGHPALRDVLDSIYRAVPPRASSDADFTLGLTGPWAWTRAVRRNMHGVLVLPQVAFACNGYSSPPCSGSHYVQHHYDGSWRVGL